MPRPIERLVRIAIAIEKRCFLCPLIGFTFAMGTVGRIRFASTFAAKCKTSARMLWPIVLPHGENAHGVTLPKNRPEPETQPRLS